MSEENREYSRTIPINGLDFESMTTNPEWGREGISDDLQRRLEEVGGYYTDKEGRPLLDDNGQPIFNKTRLWGLLGFYTRDMRLGNLDYKNNEVQYCQYYLDLANDLLQLNYIKSFLICISRVATVLELSQSKGGFLRKRQGTITKEEYRQELEPPKKNLFGVEKKNNNRY